MPSGGDGLAGRVILVTGASSGLGAHFAVMLAARGARLVLGARRRPLLADVESAIVAAGGQAISVALDVTDPASVAAAYDVAEQAYGPVDTVIANAGTNVEGPAIDLDIADFDQVMAVNVRGLFLTVREGARRLMAIDPAQRRDGRIVIISSITAQSVSPGLAVYSASKAAVLQLGRVLARDWLIPLLRERYFFAIPSDGEHRRMLQPILTALQSASFRSQVASLPGYEAADTGRVLSIAEAFGD